MGQTSQPYLPKSQPEVLGHLGIEEWVETRVGVGQHVGKNLRHIISNLRNDCF